MEDVLIEFEADTKLPKYQQFVNSILNRINAGELKVGDKLPSIITSSMVHDLSRDTVSKAYKELFEKGIITCIYRKGYFVSSTKKEQEQKRVLFISGKCNTTSHMFYNQFSRELEGGNIQSDYMLCYNDLQRLESIINKEIGNYHVFVVEPQILSKRHILEIFQRKMVRSKVIFINDDNEDLSDAVGHISFSIADEFHVILSSLSSELERYSHLNLVLPDSEYFPSGLINGFCGYCDETGKEYSILDEFDDVEEGHGYFVIDEASLFRMVDHIKRKDLCLGTDVGLTALFEHDYLKYMLNGITSINWFNGRVAECLVQEIVNGAGVSRQAGGINRIGAEVLLRNSI